MARRLLDLYCGEGGCSEGYRRAGFDVVGVDHIARPRYPFEFVKADALEVLADRAFIGGFDAVHASPPCKSENPLRHLHDVEHPDLLTPTLEALRDLPQPWVVENVSGTAKMPGALLMCGAAFGLGATCRDGVWRPLRRHRLFESNVLLMGAGCACSGRQPVGVYGHGGGGQMTRGYKATLADAKACMGIDWMTREGISQAIPPAYTEHVGGQLLAHLERENVA
jgi:DNA (cytosine-5)-methyltransferase 1